MEEFQLTETEKRYFGDLFLCCDSDNSGKVPIYKASEFFRSSNLPLDVLKQITELCGGGRESHLSRRQFYSALKLVAAYQSGLPLCPELLQAPLEVPLPRFSWTTALDRLEPQHVNRSPDLIQLSDTDHTPTPLRPESPSRPMSPTGAPASPEASSTASDSPTPTNSVQERNWAAAQWGCEEQRQLLATEEESSDRHSSEEEGDEVWTITAEQRDYYTAQFRSLQPDPRGLVAGSVARTFFEKSRLPVQELRRIWQLADVTKDGALSLAEFNTAMHLVVLRRNNIALPAALPPQLVPADTPPPPPGPSPPPGDPRSKEWTKFVDSPTSSVSSPGPKPVNFDFHKSAVERDPKILHPVPLRVTPESQGLPPGEEEPCRSPRKPPEPIPYEQLGDISPKKDPTDLRPIQRPQPKKPAAPGPGAIPPPPHPIVPLPADEGAPLPAAGTLSGPTSLPVAPAMAPKKEPPPPPPPRPYRTHARSSSLDLNRISKGGSLLGAPPMVPPRISPSSTSPKKLVGQRSEGDVLALVGEEGGRRHGAFEVYRKPPEGRDSLRRLQESNWLLRRVCQELGRELVEMQEARAALELQLELARSQAAAQ